MRMTASVSARLTSASPCPPRTMRSPLPSDRCAFSCETPPASTSRCGLFATLHSQRCVYAGTLCGFNSGHISNPPTHAEVRCDRFMSLLVCLMEQGLLMLSASVSSARGYVPDVARWLNHAAASGDVEVAKQVSVRVKVRVLTGTFMSLGLHACPRVPKHDIPRRESVGLECNAAATPTLPSEAGLPTTRQDGCACLALVPCVLRCALCGRWVEAWRCQETLWETGFCAPLSSCGWSVPRVTSFAAPRRGS